jgi:hypothetical protein
MFILVTAGKNAADVVGLLDVYDCRATAAGSAAMATT